ncbi:MAG TPA: hypothetical protein VIH17_12900 [Candidatus Acidoferrales bacterium]
MGNPRGVKLDFEALEARRLRAAGRAGLRQAGRPGRKPRLSAAALRRIEQGLRRDL